MKVVSTLAVLVLLFETLTGAEDPSIEITLPFHIDPYTSDSRIFPDVGEIPGSRSCGAAGEKVSIRAEKCVTSEPPCNLTADGDSRNELVFIPSQSTTGLGVNIRIIVDGETNTYESLLPEVSVEAGREYSVTFAGGTTSELLGKHITTQVEIFRMSDKEVEVCSEQDHYVVG